MNARTRPSKVKPHQLDADLDIPADHRGYHRCRTCGLMGTTGDAHHPDPSAPRPVPARRISPALADAAHARDAAILGEKEDLE